MAAHESLNRFGNDFPGLLGVEILRDASLVDFDSRESTLQRFERDHHVPECGPNRTNRGAVGQIALPSRDRKLIGEMLEQRVGDAEIALAVFEIDWIHFMRHHRRAGLAGHDLLYEVANRDVAPHVAAESEQDGVDPHHDPE